MIVTDKADEISDALAKGFQAAGTIVNVESGASGYTVKATRAAQTFVWTGAQGTAWEVGANWTVGGVAASGAPLAFDTVSIPAGTANTNLTLHRRGNGHFQ